MGTLSSPTLGKLLTNVRNFLNQPDNSNSFWTDQELTEYINEGIRMYFSEVIENNEGQFTKIEDLDIVTGSELVALPADFFKAKVLYKKVTDGFIPLVYLNDIVHSYSTNSGSSYDTFLPRYQFRDNNLLLRPVPDYNETDGLRLEYVYFPDTLVQGGDAMTAQVSPVFKQVVEMYAVYKAKVKESLVNGVDTSVLAKQNLAELVNQFKAIIKNRSQYPQFVVPFMADGSDF